MLTRRNVCVSVLSKVYDHVYVDIYTHSVTMTMTIYFDPVASY
jgi:hypothetical protein